LRDSLASGKSLADVANDKSKSVSGLQDAIVARATSVLAAAVSAGDLTAAQRDTILTPRQEHGRRARRAGARRPRSGRRSAARPPRRVRPPRLPGASPL